MVSFRSGAPRARPALASRPGPSGPGAASLRSERAAGDAAIRREFGALAARIRVLQRRAAREAAVLSAR
ncbi:hypothetical protein D3218_04725 [Aureimonas flava]|uniref:Uncharacterized protein n=1 Tax=Aureimonas flava TaxID=2320271 RepID=A0A3A1WWB8_9HYPH|nr:hypothetical protein [Aureimonas flava]RIY02668.1 hypothetical protein D3218_04725 [Aureimonas flava]